MEGGGEAVRLVAHGHEQAQGGGGEGEADRFVAAHGEDLLALLGQADDRHLFQAQAGKYAARALQLPLAAVDEDQVRRGLVLGQEPHVAPGHHFAQGLEIVDGAAQRAELEAPVGGLVRLALEKAHERADRVLPGQVGDVEPLDAQGKRIEAERGLELGQAVDAAHGHVLLGIGLRHAGQAQLALGRGGGEPAAERLGEGANGVRPGREGSVDRRGRAARRRVVLEEELAQCLLGRGVAARAEDLLADERAPLRLDDGEGGEVLLDRQAEVVLGRLVRIEMPLGLRQAAHRLELVAVRRRPLVLEGGRRLAHLRLELADELVRPAFEELHHPGHALGVGFLGDGVRAGPGAAPDVVIEAGARLLGDGAAALAQGIEPLHHAQVDVEVFHSRERPEVARAVEHEAPRAEEPRPLLVREPDDGVGLAVLELDVVFGLPALDETVLGGERLVLAPGDDGLDVVYVLHEEPRLRVFLPREIGVDPFFQALGLAHVDDASPLVLHDVDAGRVAEVLDFFKHAGFPARGSVFHALACLKYSARPRVWKVYSLENHHNRV